MADTTVTLSNTAFTALDAGAGLNVQNLSNQDIIVEFAASLPAVTSKKGKVLERRKGISRDGMTGTMYGLSTLPLGDTRVQTVSVGS